MLGFVAVAEAGASRSDPTCFVILVIVSHRNSMTNYSPWIVHFLAMTY